MTTNQDTRGKRILVIDDDVELCQLVNRFLTQEGFEMESVNSGSAGSERALSASYALIVLDVMMPEVNGFDVLRRIRAQSPVPVLMLTAKGDALDRVLGLEMGADDYLAKPFNPQELVARIRAILRRTTAQDTEPKSPRTPLLIGDVEMDRGARIVRRQGEIVNLTSVEFDLLEALLQTPGQVISREKLTHDVLGRAFSPFDRSIDTHVCNLRKKIGLLPQGTERIKGVRGIGYVYALPAETNA